MSEETHTTEVVVHKGTIKLATGESVGQFTRALGDAGRAHVLQKLNLTNKTASAYMLEVYSDSAIFDVIKYATPNGDGSSEYKYYAVSYNRTDSGTFEFGQLLEVERVTNWQAKASTTNVMKRALPRGWKPLWENVI